MLLLKPVLIISLSFITNNKAATKIDVKRALPLSFKITLNKTIEAAIATSPSIILNSMI